MLLVLYVTSLWLDLGDNTSKGDKDISLPERDIRY